MYKMKKIKLLALLIVAIAIYSCATVPLTQLHLVGDDQVNPAAAASYKQLLSDPNTKVITAGTDARRVKRIGDQLAAAIQQYLNANGYANQYNFAWEFNLIQSSEINAWCMPGGKVAVYSGILPITQNDAGLATVMGHEIGHAIARHSAERMSQQMLLQTGGAALGAATNGKSQITQDVVNQVYGIGGQVALLKYSRNQESEADRLGLTFMAMAGYDPHEAVGFWQRMAAQDKSGGTPEFLRTHPSDATRIANIQSLIPEAMKYYKGK
jgi:predicted Zn-dependent protease